MCDNNGNKIITSNSATFNLPMCLYLWLKVTNKEQCINSIIFNPVKYSLKKPYNDYF